MSNQQQSVPVPSVIGSHRDRLVAGISGSEADLSPVSSPAFLTTPQSAAVRLGRGQKVYVVDDEILIADTLTEILIRSGFAARAFYDGRDAVDCARVDCPDLLVSDVQMPHYNGVQLAMAVKKLSASARIVLFSGHPSAADLLREAEKTSGYSFRFLAKPVHPRALLEALAA